MGVLTHKVLVRHLAVGEVGPSATRDSDFFGHFLAVVDEQNIQAQLPSQPGAKEPGCARTQDRYVKIFHRLDYQRRERPRGQGTRVPRRHGKPPVAQ